MADKAQASEHVKVLQNHLLGLFADNLLNKLSMDLKTTLIDKVNEYY